MSAAGCGSGTRAARARPTTAPSANAAATPVSTIAALRGVEAAVPGQERDRESDREQRDDGCAHPYRVPRTGSPASTHS